MSSGAGRFVSQRNYIGGRFIEAAAGSYAIPNPATEETIAHAPDGCPDDIDRAIEAARQAFDTGTWPRIAVEERAAMLSRVADGIERRKQEFRDLLVSVAGAEAPTHWIQLEAPIELLRTYAELARAFPFEERMADVMPPSVERAVATLLVRQPVGVCALMPTWNFPLWVTCQKLGPALAAGCTMVVRPHPWVPVVDLLLAEIVDEAGVPAGVFNVVSSPSVEAAKRLVESPSIDMVSFTGSNSTGQAIMQSAGRNLTRCHLELGGKSALIVLDDCDLDAAAASAALPVAVHAGQGCALMTRVLVQRSRHDALVDRMKRHIEANVVVGDPADADVVLGPLIRPERRDAVEEYIASARSQGADLVTGGGRPAGLSRGWFIEPTLFGNVSNDMRIAREEIFGPVVAVIPFDDEEHAIRLANESSYGLFGGVLTEDAERGRAIAKRLRVGGVSINGAVNSFHKPSGGFKHSGIGRENGRFGIETFTELQAVMWPEAD